jgi:hypothetical protein
VDVTVELTEPVLGRIVLGVDDAEALLPTARAVAVTPASKTAASRTLNVLSRRFLDAM